MSWSYSDLLNANWSSLPGDIIDSIVPYLPARDVLNLCLYNDTFNHCICQNRDSMVWKLLYQRDISENVPHDHIASHYLEIMNEILPLTLNRRLIYGAKHGYNEMVKSALQSGANIHAVIDEALRWAAQNGHIETIKLLLDRGADIYDNYDYVLDWAAMYGHTGIVKFLLDRGANIHAENDSALLNAVLQEHPETVKILLKHGATITPEIRRMVGLKGDPEIVALLK